MLYLILALIPAIPLVLGLLFALFGPKVKQMPEGLDLYDQRAWKEDPKNTGVVRRGGLGLFVIALALLTLLTAFFATARVGARSIGIQTSFGKYQDTLEPGFQLKQPWANVETFSQAIQDVKLEGDNVVGVNYLGGGQGNVRAQVRWQIADATKAEQLWRKYQSFDRVKDRLVTAAARDSFRVVLGKYTPVDARTGENLRPITEDVIADLRKNLEDDGVVVDSVSVQSISVDEATQRAIEQTVQANQKVEQAEADQRRAKIDAETARLRAAEGALSPEANQRYCLELVNAWDVAKNGPLPATFDCSLAGGERPGVLVNAQK